MCNLCLKKSDNYQRSGSARSNERFPSAAEWLSTPATRPEVLSPPSGPGGGPAGPGGVPAGPGGGPAGPGGVAYLLAAEEDLLDPEEDWPLDRADDAG